MNDKPSTPSKAANISVRLLGDIRKMIEETRAGVAATVNAGLTMLYWRIGSLINQEILKGKRADYGAEIVPTLSRQLRWPYFQDIPVLANCCINSSIEDDE